MAATCTQSRYGVAASSQRGPFLDTHALASSSAATAHQRGPSYAGYSGLQPAVNRRGLLDMHAYLVEQVW
jgi:hypothetical protein